MSEADQYDELIDICTEIKLLTGVVVYSPDDPNGMLERQISTIHRFLRSNPKYCNLTLTEIIHAFYLNNQGEFADSVPSGSGGVFRHYNKEFNCEFLGDVLNAYIRKKLRMYDDHHYEIWKILDPPAERKMILSNDDWKEFIQKDYDLYRSGDQGLIFNTDPKYMFLRKCQLIQFTSRKKWFSWYVRALNINENRQRVQAIRQRLMSGQERHRMLDIYEVIRKTGVVPKDIHISTLTTMRRQCVLKFFELISACAINNIFTEIEHYDYTGQNR